MAWFGKVAVVSGATAAMACGSPLGSSEHVAASAASGGMAHTGMGGTAGANVVGSGGTNDDRVPEPVPDVEGRWAMFYFEDPVVVELSESGGVLSGTGCYAGFPQLGHALQPGGCQPVSGAADGRYLEFSFRADIATYAAHVFVSADGQRMAGRFHDVASWVKEPLTWLRVTARDRWLPQPSRPSTVLDAVEPRARRYAIAEPEGSGELGVLALIDWPEGAAVIGSLGAFWETELTWDEAAQTLRAGPVPETDPALPIELILSFQDVALVSVAARYSSGQSKTFVPHE